MHVNKNVIKKKTWDRLWSQLVGLVSQTRTKQDTAVLLESLLAPTERQMMVKRLMIGIMTIHGWEASHIATQLKLSKSTVYKFQAILEKDPAYKKLLKNVVPLRTNRQAQAPGTISVLIDAILTGRQQRSKLHYIGNR